MTKGSEMALHYPRHLTERGFKRDRLATRYKFKPKAKKKWGAWHVRSTPVIYSKWVLTKQNVCFSWQSVRIQASSIPSKMRDPQFRVFFVLLKCQYDPLTHLVLLEARTMKYGSLAKFVIFPQWNDPLMIWGFRTNACWSIMSVWVFNVFLLNLKSFCHFFFS